MKFDPGKALGGDATVDGILNGPQRVPCLDDGALHLRAAVIAIGADESVDDRTEVVERWGEHHVKMIGGLRKRMQARG